MDQESLYLIGIKPNNLFKVQNHLLDKVGSF